MPKSCSRSPLPTPGVSSYKRKQLAMEARTTRDRVTYFQKAHFTTGDIAVLVGSAAKTVHKWMEAGEFPNSYRLPPTPKHRFRLSEKQDLIPQGDRRIPRSDVVEFCRRYKIAHALAILLPQEDAPVLLVGLSPTQKKVLKSRLPEKVKPVEVHSLVEAMAAITEQEVPPSHLFVHAANPNGEIRTLQAFAARWAEVRGGRTKIVIVYPAEFAVAEDPLARETEYISDENLHTFSFA